MPELSAADFERFFEALWHKKPFAWQCQLAKRVLENRAAPWPEVIGLPTGSGKTACIDIAIFALAASTCARVEGKPLPLPRRLFFTVDRRIIVDEAFERARNLATRLRDAADGILKDVAERLRSLSGEEDRDSLPLEAHVLRGGMYRAEGWAKSPTKPTIICTTVDQLGSRLLFRAYGRSFKAWPIHAGLVANDSLILLDEAHCARPLLQTLAAIRQYRTWANEPLQNPFFVSIMSATPPPGMEDVFTDESGEPKDPEHSLGKRQLAAKYAVLCEPIKGTSKTADNKLTEELAKQALAHVDDTHRAIVIFCNRVATARAVHAILSGSKRHSKQTVLLTGRMRPIDKDDVVAKHLAALASDRSDRRVLEEPVIVVATQTLEVGADLDFDALVTECASLDALRQRFGRLNRMGRAIDAKASIVVRENQTTDSSDDPVYGAALANTWQWLKQIAGDGDAIDFGIAALDNNLANVKMRTELTVTPPLTPVMLPAHIDGWAQTAPQPEPTADVSLFLHGVDRGSADVQVCWRADIELGSDDEKNIAIDTLTLAPPTTAECLPVPIGMFRRWLEGQSVAASSSDLEGEAPSPDSDDDQPAPTRKSVRWRNRNEVGVIDGPYGLRPGDVCILSASLRDSLILGDVPAGARLDIGDRAALQTHAKAQLRLHEGLLQHWPPTKSVRTLQDWLPQAQASYDEDPRVTLRGLLDLLEKIAGEIDDGPDNVWLKTACRALAEDKHPCLDLHPSGGFILHGSRRLKQSTINDSFGDEDDATASGTLDVTLPSHLEGVGCFAERFALACGLPPHLVDTLRRAGRLHDLGKADPRFQSILRNGNPWARGPLLAKSGTIPQGRQQYEAARVAAGYPKGGRHELLSVRLAESAPDLLPSDPLLRDLVLHLVASHHGWCRPFAPVVMDESPEQVSFEFDNRQLVRRSDTRLERLDSGVSERYWRLTRHFGWWGLAWLEAILRLADHRRSEWEESHPGESE
jgi:CRISPR-associated endonuclease/helicase Cas3